VNPRGEEPVADEERYPGVVGVEPRGRNEEERREGRWVGGGGVVGGFSGHLAQRKCLGAVLLEEEFRKIVPVGFLLQPV